MTDSTLAAPAAPDTAVPADVAELAAQLPVVQRGARWFWWIAGLSAVNVVIVLSNGQTRFPVGLCYTEVAEALFESELPLQVAFDALVVAGFVLAGRGATRGSARAFVVGMVAYVLDALIFLAAGDWVPVMFHALAMVYIVQGYRALRAAKQAAGFA